mgnify:CR=1 FL=1
MMSELIPPVSVPEGQRGPWRVDRFEITEEMIKRDAFRMGRRVPQPGIITRLMHHGEVVMSDTKAERSDHFAFVMRATGHVLINGLGLGMCLGAVLRKPEVERVTVVEVDDHVIHLVAPTYQGDPRVEIVAASAFDYRPPRGVRYGAVWHDIWTYICTDNLDEMTRLDRIGMRAFYGRRLVG